jgi:long-subunit fatty acid transport protein
MDCLGLRSATGVVVLTLGNVIMMSGQTLGPLVQGEPVVADTNLPFSTSASYSCQASDNTTAAGIINATNYSSASSVTFTETNGTNTDVIRYTCTGY